MFKGKRNIFIAMVAIIALVGLNFAGCSKSNTDLQTAPKIGNNTFSIQTKSVGNNTNYSYQYLYWKNEFRDINPQMILLNKKFILDLIINAINENKINFKKDEYKNAFLEKMVNLENNMVNNANIKGVTNKIANDIMDKIDKWVSPEHQYSVNLALEGELYLLIHYNEFDKHILNVDYFAHPYIQGFTFSQSFNGVKDLILQLEGNLDDFINDPVFYSLVDMVQENMVVYPNYNGGANLAAKIKIKLPGKKIGENDCQCPDDANKCHCYLVAKVTL